MKTSDLFQYIKTTFGEKLISQAALVDQNANGVQILGTDNVKKVALGVSCNLEFLQKAVNWGAQVCIFHHGLGLSDHYIYNSQLLPSTQKELKLVFENGLTIAGFHYCLDVHPVIGNNAQIIKLLDAKFTNEAYFDEWGWIGEFDQEIELSHLAHNLARICKHDVFIVKGNEKKIKRIGVCSGGAVPKAQEIWQEITTKNVDIHLTGVITESSPALAKENGFNYLSAGHYATEVFGVKALGKEIKQRFPELEVQFIEVWNDL